MLNCSPDFLFQILPPSLDLLLMDSCLESETHNIVNTHSFSVRFPLFKCLLLLSFHHCVDLIFGALLLFLEVFARLEVCLLDQCLGSSAFVSSIPTRTVILAKLFAFFALSESLSSEHLKITAFLFLEFFFFLFHQRTLGGIDFSTFSILTSNIAP